MIIVAVLFYFTAIRESDQDKISGNAKLRINVVGFQWSWQFNYLDDGLSVTGRPGQLPQLVLPVGEKIRFYETSPDVIHAWWVIPFLFKRDVVPGRTNSFELTVTHTGLFKGKCTEFCGTDHDRMLFTVRAVSPADYQTWLAQTKATAAGGNSRMFTVYDGPTSLTADKTGKTQGTYK
jgi:cytochrome c oxidase subunit 2